MSDSSLLGKSEMQNVLLALARQYLQAESLPLFLSEALTLIGQTLHLPIARIVALEAGTKKLLASFDEADNLLTKMMMEDAEPQLDYAFLQKQMVWIEDTAREKRFVSSQYYKRRGVKGALLMPVSQKDDANVLLELPLLESRVFSDEELEFLQLALNSIGFGLENFRLHQKAEKTPKLFQEVLERSVYGVWRYDIATEKLYWNERHYEMLGLSPLTFDLTVESARNLVHPDDQPELASILQTSRCWNYTCELELRVRHADGHYLHVSSQVSVVIDEAGQPFHVMGLTLDITERKHQEMRLKESEERFRAIADRAPFMIWTTRADGLVNYTSQSWYDFVGRTEKRELEWDIPIHPEDIDSLTEHYLDCLARHTVFQAEFRMLRYDGQYRWFFSTGNPRFDRDGNFIGFVGCYMDIHDRKLAEQELKGGLERERCRRQVLELCRDTLDIQEVSHGVADMLGRFLQVDRCFLVTYNHVWQNSTKPFTCELSGQYLSGEHIKPWRLESVPSYMFQPLTESSYPVGAPVSQVQSKTEFLNYLTSKFLLNNNIPLDPLAAEEALQEVADVVFDEYGVQSTLRIDIVFRARTYGTLILQQCDYSRVWPQPEIELLKDITYYVGSVCYQAELYREEEEAKQALEKSYRLIRMVSEAQGYFITSENHSTLFNDLLHSLLLHTDSHFGFIGEVTTGSSGKQSCLKCHFLRNLEHMSSGDLQDALVHEFYTLDEPFGDEGGGYFGPGARLDQVLILEGEQLAEIQASWPSGYRPIHNFMLIPLYQAEELMGVVGIADRPQGYAMDIAKELQPYWLACTSIIIGVRMESARNALTSELQASQESLCQYAAKLEQSNKDLEQFATIASHDLQAPLRKVAMFSEFLQSLPEVQLSAEGVDYVDRLQKSIGKMQTLIDELLTLSRINRRGKPFRPVDLGEVIQDVLADLAVYQQEVQGHVWVGETMTIEADAMQMHQMLQNLIGNALKFHRPGVPPVVQVQAYAVDSEFCEITVSDKGIGFEEKDLDRIFTIFERLHSAQNYSGAGMGLAIVQKIVERHGGTITAKSTVNAGSVFVVRLPIFQSEKKYVENGNVDERFRQKTLAPEGKSNT